MLKTNLLWGILGAVIVASCLGIGVVVLARSGWGTSTALYPTAIIKIIPAPTLTPSPQPIPSPVPQAGGSESLNDSANGIPIRVGDSVQIYGTQGDGLRLRAVPGLEGQILFLAYEGEIFIVKDGPRLASDYVWWYLVAPYDENIKGWAVENYLKPIER